MTTVSELRLKVVTKNYQIKLAENGKHLAIFSGFGGVLYHFTLLMFTNLDLNFLFFFF